MIAAADAFEELESDVRRYCRLWPAVFSKAKGSHIYDERGGRYLDFFAGAGTLNYGHNHPHLKDALLRYLQDDSIVHSLDMYTTAKRQFLEAFQQDILAPRGFRYKAQFPGPAGCTAVEAALKLARKYTGRSSVATFTNSFHGMTLGALAVSGQASLRKAAGPLAGDVIVLPYDRAGHNCEEACTQLDRLLDEGAIETPAAMIVETTQGEGGMQTASAGWLRQLASFCGKRGVLLIVDDVQMGCGRTGPFFSFEHAGITPDMVCLSKSLSGFGLPFALTLLRPELDVWTPGEHSGTFRGLNLAFVTAAAAIDLWRDGVLEQSTLAKGIVVQDALRAIAADHGFPEDAVRGRGMAWGLAFRDKDVAGQVCRHAFESGLLVETSGSGGEVIKLLPPLTIADGDLALGLDIFQAALRSAQRDLLASDSGQEADTGTGTLSRA